MDGFTAANVDPTDPTGSRAMGYYDQTDLPFYYALVQHVRDQRPLLLVGPRSRRSRTGCYLLAGTSFGHIRNDSHRVGYTQKTIFELARRGATPVSWKIYRASAVRSAAFQVRADRAAGHVFPISQYFADAATATCRRCRSSIRCFWRRRDTENDEHPPANVQVGQKFVAESSNALVTSPNWATSAMFLTYDEHGGFYDHVPPPAGVPPDDIPPMLQPGDPVGAFDRYGVRVPVVVVSPYAKPHYVSHVVYDHTSILRFIETRFGLPAAHPPRRQRRPDARHVRLPPRIAAPPQNSGRSDRPCRRGTVRALHP